MPNFRYDGIEFCFEARGRGRPFIFSHSLGGNLGQSIELIGDLPDTRLIVYDSRAHGRTTPLGDPAGLNFGAMAKDMAALLDYLNIPSAFVGGVSMGAGISLAFALGQRPRVKGLVLSRPAWLNVASPTHLSVFAEIAQLVGRLGLERARQEFERTPFYQNLQRDYPTTAKSLSSLFNTNASREALVASFQALPACAPVDSLKKLCVLDVPSLVLGNRNDPIHPFELAITLAGALPGSRFCEFPSKSESVTAHYQQFRCLVAEFLGTFD